MALKKQIPFQQILTVVKTLTPAQKARLRDELNNTAELEITQTSFTELLKKGPVFTTEEINTIKENRNLNKFDYRY